MRHINWDDLRILQALVQFGNVRMAGEKLNMSHSTVARRVAMLERSLSTPLLIKERGVYHLTDEGETFLAVAENIRDQVASLERHTLGRPTTLYGSVRLTMIDAMIHSPVMSILREFMEQHPQLHIELDIRNDLANLSLGEADLALRFSMEPDPHLVGFRLFVCGTAVYCSHDYKQRLDENNSMFSPSWIGFTSFESKNNWRQNTPFPEASVRGTMISQAAQLAACRNGQGLGLLPCFMAESEADLVRLSRVQHPKHYDLWVLRHPDLLRNVRVRVLAEFLRHRLKEKEAVFLGPTEPEL